MDKIKTYVVGGDQEYANWFSHELVDTIENADLVLFTGGEDVNPNLYKEPAYYKTYFNPQRDKKEVKAYIRAQSLGKHIVGICRGSQLLCVMSGGKLVQDQQNLNYIHPIITYDGKLLDITSTHHQAAYPFKMPKSDYRILGWSEDESSYHRNGHGDELNPPFECEVVVYPKTKSLGIQGHPERMNERHYSDTLEWLRKELNNFMKY